MKDLFTVVEFTIKDMVKKKAFIISMIIILVLIVVGFNIPNIINKLKGEDSWNYKILLVDNENIFEGYLEVLNQKEAEYNFEIAKEILKEEDVKKEVEDGNFNAALIFTRNDEGVKIKYVVESVASFGNIPEEVLESFNTIYTNVQISKLNLTQEELNSISTQFNVEVIETDENAAKGDPLIVMLLSMALFLAIHFFAFQVSSSITTEKTSRIVETLITSTKPKVIVVGKTIGAGIVGLLQLLVIIIVAGISAKSFLPSGTLDGILDMSNITVFLGLLMIFYFICGYFLFAFLYALTGSTVSKPEDISSANSPIGILEIVGFYLAYFSMMNPSSKINMIASIIPISSPFSMPFRVMLGTATNTQIIASVLILIATIVLVAKISIKIYSSAILNNGTRMNFKDIIKVYKSKT